MCGPSRAKDRLVPFPVHEPEVNTPGAAFTQLLRIRSFGLRRPHQPTSTRVATSRWVNSAHIRMHLIMFLLTVLLLALY